MSRMIATLAGADGSVLPKGPPDPAVSAIDAWLRDARRDRW